MKEGKRPFWKQKCQWKYENKKQGRIIIFNVVQIKMILCPLKNKCMQINKVTGEIPNASKRIAVLILYSSNVLCYDFQDDHSSLLKTSLKFVPKYIRRVENYQTFTRRKFLNRQFQVYVPVNHLVCGLFVMNF